MRYIRFLKTPRIVAAKNAQKKDVACLITITSDLGDSFLPYDVQLSAQLLLCTPVDEQVLVWTTVQWRSGMRSLPIVIPLPKHHALPSSPLRLRIGTEPKNAYDDYSALAEEDARGVVSASSPTFTLNKEAPKLAERRFKLSDGSNLCIWEETGESIARHLWDAGITLSCKIPDLAHPDTVLSKALSSSNPVSHMTVLELGTGCGIVGIALAQTIPNATVLLTDLPEAREIVQRNIDQASTASGASLRFLQLDWDVELPDQVHKISSPISLVIAADCTYNSDSRYDISIAHRCRIDFCNIHL
jgi:hypothetical protein